MSLARTARASALLAACSFAAAVGCSSGADDSSSGVVRRDSAGIEIVTNPPLAERWVVDPTPRLSIGEVEGDADYQLFQVVGARRLTDGRLVIANAGSHELRFYDMRGRFLSRNGGQGDGPGEFQRIMRLDVSREDSIYVWDGRHFRRSAFGPKGEFARDHRLEPPWEGGFPNYVGLFSDGSLLAGVGETITDLPADRTVMRRSNVTLRYTAEGQPLDTIGSFTTRGNYLRVYEGGQGGIEFFNIPFDQGTVWAIRGTGLYETSGGVDEVRELAEDGSVVRILRIDQASRPVTPELRAAAIAVRLESYTNEEARANGRSSYEDMPFPQLVQAYDRLLVDDSDHLWARRHPLPHEETAVWRVFDPTGWLVGEVEVPEGLAIWQVGEDFVLGSMRDEFDIERVVMYGLVRPPAASLRG